MSEGAPVPKLLVEECRVAQSERCRINLGHTQTKSLGTVPKRYIETSGPVPCNSNESHWDGRRFRAEVPLLDPRT